MHLGISAFHIQQLSFFFLFTLLIVVDCSSVAQSYIPFIDQEYLFESNEK